MFEPRHKRDVFSSQAEYNLYLKGWYGALRESNALAMYEALEQARRKLIEEGFFHASYACESAMKKEKLND